MVDGINGLDASRRRDHNDALGVLRRPRECSCSRGEQPDAGWLSGWDLELPFVGAQLHHAQYLPPPPYLGQVEPQLPGRPGVGRARLGRAPLGLHGSSSSAIARASASRSSSLAKPFSSSALFLVPGLVTVLVYVCFGVASRFASGEPFADSEANGPICFEVCFGCAVPWACRLACTDRRP